VAAAVSSDRRHSWHWRHAGDRDGAFARKQGACGRRDEAAEPVLLPEWPDYYIGGLLRQRGSSLDASGDFRQPVRSGNVAARIRSGEYRGARGGSHSRGDCVTTARSHSRLGKRLIELGALPSRYGNGAVVTRLCVCTVAAVLLLVGCQRQQ